MRSLEAKYIQGKTVFLRCDFNISIFNDHPRDISRITMSLPTIQFLLAHDAKIILASHLGRPEGKIVEHLRLAPIRKILEKELNIPIWYNGNIDSEELRINLKNAPSGSIFLLENIQFDPGECTNSSEYAQQLASLADVYVNDAFAQSHRSYASLVEITKYLPSFAGFLMEKECDALEAFMTSIVSPCVVVMGGVKIETKLPVVQNLTTYADTFLFGGGIANTLLYAQGKEIGTSLAEREHKEQACFLLNHIRGAEDTYILPTDIRGKRGLETIQLPLDKVTKECSILDIGPQTEHRYIKILEEANTIIWNGPLGYIEEQEFSYGTRHILEAMSKSKASTLIGGGDSLDALQRFGISQSLFTHVSSGGGAMLQYLEGNSLPAIIALQEQE